MSRTTGDGRRARPAVQINPAALAPEGHRRRATEGQPALALGRDGHPFRFDYIGLGLLDEASIRREGDAWVAEYPDERGRPYLRVRLDADGQATLEERDEDGRLVATTVGRSLTEAIGRHGTYALDKVSPFWIRVVRLEVRAWIAVTIPDIQFSFIPAIGIGGLYVPVPLDLPWIEPAPGPIARRIGLLPTPEGRGRSGATLLRFVAGEHQPRDVQIRLVRYELPGILVAETVAAIHDANGLLRSIEWRPFVLPQPVVRVGQVWGAPPPTALADGSLLTGFAIVEDE